jgi:hypothetical protein
MSVDLISKRKITKRGQARPVRLCIGNDYWRLLLALARQFGWKPKWTKLPGNKDWDGSYTRNCGQVVTAPDGLALSKALKKALHCLSKNDLCDDGAREAILKKTCNMDVINTIFGPNGENIENACNEICTSVSFSPDQGDIVGHFPDDVFLKMWREFPDYCHQLSRLELLQVFSGQTGGLVEELAAYCSAYPEFEIW